MKGIDMILIVVGAVVMVAGVSLYSKSIAESQKSVRQVKDVSSQVTELQSSQDSLKAEITSLKEELETVRKKADAADYTAHSAKMDFAKMPKTQKLEIEMKPVKLYHIRARIKQNQKVRTIDNEEIKSSQAILNQIKTQITELNQ